MSPNSLFFYHFFVYISPKIDGRHKWDFGIRVCTFKLRRALTNSMIYIPILFALNSFQFCFWPEFCTSFGMPLLTWSISATVCTIGTTYRKVVRTTSTTQSRTTMIRMNPANWITCNFPIFGWIHSLSYSISKHNHSICIFPHWQWFRALIHWICLGENVLGEFSHNHKDFHKILILPEICSGSPGRGFIGSFFFHGTTSQCTLYPYNYLEFPLNWNFELLWWQKSIRIWKTSPSSNVPQSIN